MRCGGGLLGFRGPNNAGQGAAAAGAADLPRWALLDIMPGPGLERLSLVT